MRLFTSSKLEKCRRNGKLRQKSLALAHWHHSSVSLSDPCDCFARIFLLCREVEGRPGGSKTSASFLQVHLSPDKSHQQPAERTAHLPVLETCTSVSVIQAFVHESPNQSWRDHVPAHPCLGGIYCAGALGLKTDEQGIQKLRQGTNQQLHWLFLVSEIVLK